MRKLGKRINLNEQTIEAYACACSCGCTCSCSCPCNPIPTELTASSGLSSSNYTRAKDSTNASAYSGGSYNISMHA